ncbi:hypothetical protein PI125_g23583 [Phytophthora idaei]|nr:hypothetical protein PI125_g23583 [Phytophthora idaei]
MPHATRPFRLYQAYSRRFAVGCSSSFTVVYLSLPELLPSLHSLCSLNCLSFISVSSSLLFHAYYFLSFRKSPSYSCSQAAKQREACNSC